MNKFRGWFRDWWFGAPETPDSSRDSKMPTLYNPRNVTFKITPNIHVKAEVTIVLESGRELHDMYDYVHSYDPAVIEKAGRDLIERYNRMMDLSETIR